MCATTTATVTQKSLQDRLWRKTRSKNTTVNRWCMGADANRNWGYRWGGSRHENYSNPEFVQEKQVLIELHVLTSTWEAIRIQNLKFEVKTQKKFFLSFFLISLITLINLIISPGLKDFFTWQITNPMVYISLHSYGQLLLSPWGYTNERTENYQDQVYQLIRKLSIY